VLRLEVENNRRVVCTGHARQLTVLRDQGYKKKGTASKSSGRTNSNGIGSGIGIGIGGDIIRALLPTAGDDARGRPAQSNGGRSCRSSNKTLIAITTLSSSASVTYRRTFILISARRRSCSGRTSHSSGDGYP
jgi:hypothetical protein